jgi:hypothetical protein
MEGDGGQVVNVVGYKEALETTLRDRNDDIDDADRSGPSHRTDFSQSTGNSIHNTDATARMHTHRECALTTIALVNKNCTLTNNLEDSEEQLSGMIVQNLILQGHLEALTNKAQNPSSNCSQEPKGNTRMDEDGPDIIRGGGGQASDSKGSAGIPGGGNQSSGGECSDDPPPWSHDAVPAGQVLPEGW